MPVDEVCDDGADNDCDGTLDDADADCGGVTDDAASGCGCGTFGVPATEIPLVLALLLPGRRKQRSITR